MQASRWHRVAGVLDHTTRLQQQDHPLLPSWRRLYCGVCSSPSICVVLALASWFGAAFLLRRSFTSHGGSAAELARRAGAKVLFVEYRCTRTHLGHVVPPLLPSLCLLFSLGSRLSILSLRPSKTRSRPTSGWSTIKRWRPTGPSLSVIVLVAAWPFSPCLLCKMRTRVHSHPAFNDTVRLMISLTRHRSKVLFLLPLRPSRCRPGRTCLPIVLRTSRTPNRTP